MTTAVESLTRTDAPLPKLYSGTAAFDLEALQAPALKVIAQINQRFAVGTHIALLPGAYLWNVDTAARWLAPLGEDLRVQGGGITNPATFQPPVPNLLHAWSYLKAGTISSGLASTPAVAKPVEAEIQSPTFDAFKDLMRWLDATDQEVADMVGIGRTTPYTWRREGREPRRSTVRLLLQVHSVVAGLVDALGEDAANRLLSIEHPEYRKSLLRGNLQEIQPAIHDLLFKRERRRTKPGSWISEGGLDDDE
jgi:hypothetical protein